MNRLLDLIRLIPGAGKVVSLGVILVGAIVFVYFQWGFVPALVVAIGVLLIGGLIFGYNAMVKASEKQSGKAFGKAIRNAQVGASRGEIRQAVGELGDKWQEAIGNFKNHELSLYELPWFMLVGEPQSGKSTTLKFSGLKFPIGIESISGGGGTRNCDWWFTEEGIILDTAGRFTFQETTATDAAEWNHFLALLTKFRPFCPINGIILVIPVTSLLGDAPAVREQKARNISDKLHHIQHALAIQFPVFVLLTKADAIYGFTEFFNKLSPDQQREMMGWSNQVLDSGFSLETFDSSFQDIQKRIHQIRKRNLSRPQYSYDANKTFIFPEEFETLHEPLRHYLSVIFESSVYKASLFFRGYYFTSGMQEGKPIVRACLNIVKQGALSDNLEKIFTKSRAFFIRDFYTQKVFPEQGLVKRGFQHVKKDRLKKRVIYSLNTLLLILGAFFMFFMHRSLNKRLDEPKAAISQTLQTFETVKGDFFSSPESRQEVYKNLKSLQSSLSQASEASYLLFLKGKQNDLTESLQDSFAYLFLDRVLTGLFDSTVTQLSAFSLKSHIGQPSSREQLTTITGALFELNKWRYQVAKGEEDDFKPTITPFLPLVLDPEWDNELAKYRHELTLAQELDQWFKLIYDGSSKKVQTTLIRDLVRRSEKVFEGLHENVVEFYLNQPEMKRYLQKLQLIDGIRAQYALLKQPILSTEDFQQKMAGFAPYFSETNLAMFAAKDEKYLSFTEIRNQTIKSAGQEFVSLATPGATASSGDKKRQTLQLDTVQFVNQLAAVNETTLKDPAQGSDQALAIPEEPLTYWNQVGNPYYDKYQNLAEYTTFPLESETQTGNLEQLFKLGGERAGLLRAIFVTGVFNTASVQQNPEEKARFESVYNDFRNLADEQELSAFDRALVRVSRMSPIRAPRPTSNSWDPLVQEFNRISDSGMDFDKFFTSLDEFQEELTAAGDAQMKTIYGRSDTPFEKIKAYKKEITKNLKSFAQNIQAMSMISTQDIASNRQKYQGNFPEKSALLQLARLEEDAAPLVESHLQSLEIWSTQFIEAWQSKVGRAEICPSCPGVLSEIKAAYFLTKDHFPVVYAGTSHRTSTKPGETTVTITRSSKENLNALISALEKFRNPTPQQAEYLKRKGLKDFFEQAMKWIDYVKKLQSGTIRLSYKLTATNEPDSIARTFSFADLDGAYVAKPLGLNSPAFRDIEKNQNNEHENFSAIFKLYNDTEGNMARSYLKISGEELDLLGFILDSDQVSQSKDTFDKVVPFLLNVNQKQLTGTFRFKLSEPTVFPPNWDTLEP